MQKSSVYWGRRGKTERPGTSINSLRGVRSSLQGMTPNRLGAAWLRGAGGIGPAPWLPGKAKQEPIEEVGDLVQELRGAQEVLQSPKGI